MGHRNKTGVAGVALAMLVAAAPARADMEFWLDNQSSVPTRAMVQEISGIHYLSPGDKNNSIAAGGWFTSKGCGGACLQNPYHVRFKHLGNDTTYCVFEVTYSVRESTGSNWGSVNVEVKVWHEEPGMRCTSSGQRSAMWHSSAPSEGVYLIFTLDN